MREVNAPGSGLALTGRRPRRPGRARRARCWLASAALLLGAVTGGTGLLPRWPAVSARADEVTASQNDLRTGWDPDEPGLSPSVVTGGSFGQLFSTPVSGQVYAQPVVAGSTVVVATENDWVYGLNAATGAVSWSVSLGPALPASAQDCSDLAPSIGVTSTPVYDPSTGTVYLVAVVNDGPAGSQPHIYLYALNAQTGAVSWKVPIQGAPVNDPTRQFDPLSERQRPGLLLMNGSVYVGFAAYCDYTPFDGYVAGISTSTHAVSLWTDEAGLTDSEAGIWQSGGGLMSDGPGRIFVATGNGVSPAAGPGNKPPSELGDAVVRLNVAADGTMSAADFFSPANAPALDAGDVDFGSGAPVGLPFGSSKYPDLLVQAGKDGRVFLLNRDSLGGREQGPKGTDDPVSMAGPYQGQWGHPAAFGDTTTVTSGNAASARDYLYYVGKDDNLRYLKFGLNAAGTPVLADVANSTNTFGYTSGSPVVTSDGTSGPSALSSAIVWEVQASAASGAGGVLDAFDAVPPAGCTSAKPCPMSPIWSAPIGTASKFSIPATDSGRVYVGTRDGHVLGFGSPKSVPLTGAMPVSFGSIAVGGSTPGQATVTLTAATSVQVSGVTASSTAPADPFAAGTPSLNGAPATWPVTMSSGDQLSVPVTFTPTAPGGVTGSLAFSTDSANFPTVSVSLSGDGTQPGFYASPGSASFGTVPDGTTLPVNVTITNGDATSETVNSATPPSGPFTITGLPADGAVMQPGASLTATVTYAPTAAGADTSSFAITSTDADGNQTTTTVNLSGTGQADLSQLTPTPASVSFGSVALGQTATQTIDIANAGNLPATVTAAVPPPIPFGAPDPVASGLPLGPGYDLQVPISFTPPGIGAVAGSYQLSWKDAAGPHTLTVPVTGTGAPPASGISLPPPGGGWTLNGSARMSGTGLVLTPAAPSQAGSAVYSVPEPSNRLSATFTVQIGGGSGADGMTLGLLNAGTSGPASLGGSGGGLGFAGLSGVAVTLDTARDNGPSTNFAGIATGSQDGKLIFAATSTHVPALRRGTHVVGVSVAGQKITVKVDGTSVLSATVPIPPSVLLAFTGATGGLTDRHTVLAASITAGGHAVPPPGGGWSYNGSAGLSGSDSVLTGAVRNQAGSVVYPVAERTSWLKVTFNAQLGGGTGANGLTFALLSPARSSASSVGGSGALVGFGGLSGVAVALITYGAPGYPGSNFIGISAAASRTALKIQAVARAIPVLRSGTQEVTVRVIRSAGTDVLVVWLDGEQVLQQPEPSMTATSLLAFTAGTGGVTDVHTVRDVAIASPG
jgi:outer membrane protein assembly factor BamB